jgi:CRISPR-associated helicase Cas3
VSFTIPPLPTGSPSDPVSFLPDGTPRYRDMLLAKWRDSRPKLLQDWGFPRGYTLRSHLSECYTMALFLIEETPFVKKLLWAMDLDISYEDFARLLLLTVLLHDIGKGSSDFQRMLWKLESSYLKSRGLWEDDPKNLKKNRRAASTILDPNDRYKQSYRHEWLGALILLAEPQYREWLVREAGSEKYADIVTSSLRGHHLKTDREPEFPTLRDVQEGRDHPVHYYGSEVAAEVWFVQARCRTPFRPLPWIGTKRWPLSDLKALHQERIEGEETKISAAIKWVTIIADTLGSIAAPADKKVKTARVRQMLQDHLREVFKPASFDVRRHLEARGVAVENLWGLQENALHSAGDALVDAGCGSGKAVTGLLAVAEEDFTCATKVIFNVPLTSAVTQLYDDHLTDDSYLRHSRSRVDADLHRFFADLEKEDPALAGSDLFLTAPPPTEDVEADVNIQALLSGFKHPVTWSTPDQVLGALGFNRSGVIWLLYIVQSQVIFDEVHAYDSRMRGWYYRFLEWFPRITTIQMSATVSNGLEEDIQKRRSCRVLKTSGRGDDPSIYPRYRFHLLESPDSARDLFRQAPEQDGAGNNGTIWMVNQVRDAQTAGRELEDAFVYHAQFPYYYKRRRQAEVVAACRGDTPIRVVCTQIAQISFDIASHMMISAVCPIDAILQRIGRLNRRNGPGGVRPTRVADVYFYQPPSVRPYGRQALARSWKWLEDLEGIPLSQADLTEAFKDAYQLPEADPVSSRLWDTKRSNLRNHTGSVTALLERHLPLVQNHPWKAPYLEFTAYLRKGDLENAPRRRKAYVVPWDFNSSLGVLKP